MSASTMAAATIPPRMPQYPRAASTAALHFPVASQMQAGTKQSMTAMVATNSKERM